MVTMVLSFRTFQFYPGIGPLQEAWFIIMALALIGIYLPWRLRRRGWPHGLELYVLAITIGIPVGSALAANREFGQPIIYGLLAHRSLILFSAVPLLTCHLITENIITIKDLELSIIRLAWFSLTLFLFMFFFLDPAPFFDTYGAGFVSSSRDDSTFVFEVVFIVFGFFYYAFKGLRQHSSTAFRQSAIFFLFLLLVHRGRSLLLSVLAVFLWFLVLWTPNRSRLVALLFKVIIAVGLIWCTLFFFKHDLYLTMVGKFSDLFTVLFTGELSDDPSANSRIQQTILALPYILNHWLIGNGNVSAQFQGGIGAAVSDYFHPSDIGLLGSVFLYGIIGTLLFLYELKFAITFSNNESQKFNSYRSFLDAAKGTVMFFGLRSIATAQIIFYPESTLFFIAILLVASNPTPNGKSNQFILGKMQH